MTKTNSPIFVVGHPRSGSTLLATRLGRHSRILALPETHFFSSSYSGNLIFRVAATLKPGWVFKYIFDHNPRLRDLEFDADSLRDTFLKDGIRSFQSALNLLFEVALKGTGKKRVLEKTPTHIENVDTIIDWYPDATVVIIIRDVRDTISSLVEAPFTHNNPHKHCAYWRWCVREAIILQSRYPKNCTLVRFEDLLASPESVLEEILSFVGETYENDVLSSESSGFVVPKWETAWKAKSENEIDKTYIGKWKNVGDIQPVWAESVLIAELEMKLLGDVSASGKSSVHLDAGLVWGKWFYSARLMIVLFARRFLMRRRNRFRERLDLL